MSRLGRRHRARAGPGETKLEIDRQHIRRRITKLRRDVKDLRATRDVKRAQPAALGRPAGRDRRLHERRQVHADATADAAPTSIVADQLFATLDPTTRRLALPGGRRATISDTVGFVGKLPHDLVEAFRSTLEEVTLADLVVHVADASSPDARRTRSRPCARVLGEIGAGDMPEVLALNKIDRLPGSERARLARRFPGSVRGVGAHGRGRRRAARGASRAALPEPAGRDRGARPVGPRRPRRDALPGGRGPRGRGRARGDARRTRGSGCASWPRFGRSVDDAASPEAS